MSAYVHPSPSDDALPVALGIKDTNLYLSCYKDGEEPTLHLEVSSRMNLHANLRTTHFVAVLKVELSILKTGTATNENWLNLPGHLNREKLHIYRSIHIWYELVVLSGVKVKPSDIYLFTPQPVEDKSSLLNISEESELVRFLFYKRDSGLSLSTLMSARFPNWYISTAAHENKPVEMSLENASRHRDFNIQRQGWNPLTIPKVEGDFAAFGLLDLLNKTKV